MSTDLFDLTFDKLLLVISTSWPGFGRLAFRASANTKVPMSWEQNLVHDFDLLGNCSCVVC